MLFGQRGDGSMAIYTTFFLCKPKELRRGFPGWRLPLAKSVRREVRNPLTGEMMVIESREPDWPEDAAARVEREYRVVAIAGRYEDYLEERLPPFVRDCPHWAAKGLTAVELTPLFKAAGVEAAMESPIYGPPSAHAFVQQLPPEFFAKLGSLDQKSVAKRWAAAMSTREHTHSVSGVKLNDGWKVKEALEILRPLVALAREGTAGQQMYLLTEF
jgi:hypothetical protein